MLVLLGFTIISMCYDHAIGRTTLSDGDRTIEVRAKAWTATSADAVSSLEASTLSYMPISYG